MGFKLLEVHGDTDFADLFQVFRAGFTNPGSPLWPLFTADYRPDPAHQEAALKETTQRMISWHRPDPTSHWLKVVDDSTGKILGGGRWALFEKGNPYDGHGDMEASWFPEGEPRELASDCLNQFLATSALHMNRPHACTLAIIFLPFPRPAQSYSSFFPSSGLNLRGNSISDYREKS